MGRNAPLEVYTPGEIAQAAGVPEDAVVAAIGGQFLVPHETAVLVGRALRHGVSAPPPAPFSIGRSTMPRQAGAVTMVMSGAVHAALLGGLVLVATLGFHPAAGAISDEHRPDIIRLVYLATPGPGGGGGGGGRLEKTPPSKALREGKKQLSSPLPARTLPPLEEKPVTPPPLSAETLPALVAPVAPVASDERDRIGVLEEVRRERESNGPGRAGGTGTGTGQGIGEGAGAGIGPGTGGGIGGGPYRPGSGILPPRLLKEVKPDYPDEDRQRGVEGEVEMEIVVRRDGSVGDVKILKGLSQSLNERAAQAVRQWRFSPASRQGAPVDVIVQVSVEFRMR